MGEALEREERERVRSEQEAAFEVTAIFLHDSVDC